MATATTSEIFKKTEPELPFAMLQQKSIFARLVEEVLLAAREFSKDPQAFIKNLFLDEAKDLQRKKLIRMGLTLAIVFHIAVGIFLVSVKWQRGSLSEANDDKELVLKHWVTPDKPEPDEPIEPEANSKDNFSKTPQEGLGGGDKNAAASGGGQNEATPANKGMPPQSALIEPVLPPTAPNVPNPALPMNPTLKGETETPPPPSGETIGSPTGTGTTPSGGTGKNGGVGEGNNGGVGNNNGPGAGNENSTGNKPGAGGTGGSPTGNIVPTGIPYTKLPSMPESTGISWISRVRPIVTPEAQENKVYGYVLLEATFNADGTITDIVVRTHLEGMDDAAIAALRKARFRPATVKGQPITLYKVPIKVPVNLGAGS
ncbi:MAG: energy transducer TonB [Acidobacteriota bacterium]